LNCNKFTLKPNPKIEVAKMVLFLIPPVFAKNISPTHRFGGYFFCECRWDKGWC